MPNELSIRKTLIEAKFSGGNTKRFWHFVATTLSFMALIFVAGVISSIYLKNPLPVIAASFAISGFLAFFEVDKAWKKITAWRKKK